MRELRSGEFMGRRAAARIARAIFCGWLLFARNQAGLFDSNDLAKFADDGANVRFILRDFRGLCRAAISSDFGVD